MITGDPMLRTVNPDAPPKVTSFRCFGKNWQDSNTAQPPGGGTDTVELPSQPCEGYLRSNTYFPQCVPSWSIIVSELEAHWNSTSDAGTE
jgi:hypothetical protein